jgi:hypothetical protein
VFALIEKAVDDAQARMSGAAALKAFGAGGKGIRTPDLLIANQPLYQLSYAPAMACKLSR